ncbi:MAG: DUF6155 family protein [Defluviitaleaceae bacterium]|nr:DUF6155 family protein [Defluviitaleaceae bacterium]
MAKDKLITAAQLKKSLLGKTESELSELILDVAKNCPQAKEYLTIKFSARETAIEILEKYKTKVEHEFYPKRGFGRLNLREAKKAISDFRKICPDKIMEIDIMLFYVENCVEFTNDYGDIGETFYNSAASVFASAVKEINSCDKAVYDNFADRIEAITTNAIDGWGFKDELRNCPKIIFTNDYKLI